MSRGIFITFEGGEGSGKSTHLRLLGERLRAEGRTVLITREPGGCPISEKIRALVLDRENVEMTPVTEALLYAAARAQHVAQVIRPALERGEIVLSDRFLDSSIAYQGYGRGLGEDLVRSINAPAIDGLMPEVTFFLSVNVRAAQGRIADRELDRLELAGLDFHERVAAAFDQLAHGNNQRIILIETSHDPKPVVHERVWQALLDTGLLEQK